VKKLKSKIKVICFLLFCGLAEEKGENGVVRDAGFCD